VTALPFPALWLRHNCPCPDCRDPTTGQRLIEISVIPNGTVATVTASTRDAVEVTFAPDGHRGVFSLAWVLTRTPWPFGYVDKETELRARQPLIGLDGLLSTLAVLRRRGLS
jgi:gamma-butyrobetaine dioxygenase